MRSIKINDEINVDELIICHFSQFIVIFIGVGNFDNVCSKKNEKEIVLEKENLLKTSLL